MSIVARILEPLEKAFTTADLPHEQTGTGWGTPGWQIPATRDYTRLVGDLAGTSIVGDVLAWYRRTFPEAILRAWQDEKDGRSKTPILQHPLVELIEKPNDYYDGDVLWAGSVASFLLDGNFFWIKAHNASTRVAELWYTPHFMIQPKGSKDGKIFIEEYEYTVNGKLYHLAPSDIVHVRNGIDPRNPRRGISELASQLREIYTDEEAARFAAAMLKNLGVPGLVVSPKSPDGTFNPKDAKAAKDKLDQEFTGEMRGRSIVMSGATQVDQLGFSPEQMDLTNMRHLPEERVSAALGVPAAVVGLGTGLAQTKVGATMHELRELAVEQALVPTWRTFGKQVGRSLLPDFSTGKKGISIAFDVSEVRVLQPDRQLLHERTRADMNAGLVMVADAQAKLGYPVDENRRVYLQPAMLMEIPAGTPPTPTPAPAPPKAKSDGPKASRAEVGFLRVIDRGRNALERAFTSRLEVAFLDLGKLAEAAYRSAPKERKASDGDIVDAIMGDLDTDGFVQQRLGPVYSAQYSAVADLVIGTYADALGVTLSIGVRDALAENIVSQGGKRLGLVDIPADTRAALFDALTEAREQQLGIPATARLIREYVPAGKFTSLEAAKPGRGVNYRSQLIARTETRFATNLSVAETGKEAGFETFRAYDDRTGFGDDECAARDGQEYSADEMMGEIDEEHPNGTLSFAPVPRT